MDLLDGTQIWEVDSEHDFDTVQTPRWTTPGPPTTKLPTSCLGTKSTYSFA